MDQAQKPVSSSYACEQDGQTGWAPQGPENTALSGRSLPTSSKEAGRLMPDLYAEAVMPLCAPDPTHDGGDQL